MLAQVFVIYDTYFTKKINIKTIAVDSVASISIMGPVENMKGITLNDSLKIKFIELLTESEYHEEIQTRQNNGSTRIFLTFNDKTELTIDIINLLDGRGVITSNKTNGYFINNKLGVFVKEITRSPLPHLSLSAARLHRLA
jgi:hypothetical protein